MAQRKTATQDQGKTANVLSTEDNKKRPVITVDYERYAHFLEGEDLSEDQKLEYLQALWSIIVEFVSLGFGVHPLQQAQEPCGQPQENDPKSPLTAPDAVYLDHQFLSDNFKELATSKSDAGQEGVE